MGHTEGNPFKIKSGKTGQMSEYSDIILEEEDRNEESLVGDDVESITKASANVILNGGNFELFPRSKRNYTYLPSVNEPITPSSKRNIQWKDGSSRINEVQLSQVTQKIQPSKFTPINKHEQGNGSNEVTSKFDFIVKISYFLIALILIGKLFFASSE